jgi:hypothetical protein
LQIPSRRMFGCMTEVTEYRIGPVHGLLDKSKGNRIS